MDAENAAGSGRRPSLGDADGDPHHLWVNKARAGRDSQTSVTPHAKALFGDTQSGRVTMRQGLRVVFLIVVILAGCSRGVRSRNCRCVVTRDAEFIHLRTNAIVILSPEIVTRMFGTRARELTLFYGSNRMLTEDGESAIVKGPLLPMSRVVRAMFFSGDEWPDLLVPVHALETKEEVLVRVNLRTDEVRIDGRRKMSQATYTVAPDGTLAIVP
jgi:hypothetical protein